MLITHSTNYYGQFSRLVEIDAEWATWDLPYKFQVIDDCHNIPASQHTSLSGYQLARITTDIPYNSAGTINLSAALCNTRYLLHTDMDIHVNQENALRIFYFVEVALVKDDRVIQFDLDFKGTRHESGGCWLCPIDLFWKLGGFDEDFTGHYGWEDMHFFEKVRKYAVLEKAPFMLEFKPEHSVPMERDTSQNLTYLQYLISQGLSTVCNKPLRFNFEIL